MRPLAAVLALAGLLTGCAGGGGDAAAKLAGEVLGGALHAAASGSPRRRDTYEYQVEVAKARGAACSNDHAALRLFVLDAAAHLRTDTVRVARWEGCEVTWLDDCRLARAEYGPARPREGDGARTIDVWDDVDLYELLPAWSASWKHPVAQGRHLRVQTLVEAVREAPAITRADIPSDVACTGATHVVSALELGAVRLNVDPKDGATERELEAQRELELGDYSACRRGEGCAAIVAVGLTPLR